VVTTVSIALIVGSSTGRVKVQTKDYEIGNCCFFTNTALWVRAKTDWVRTRIMCLEWSDMSAHRLLFSKLALFKNPVERVVEANIIIIISSSVTCSFYDIAEKRNNFKLNLILSCPWYSWKDASCTRLIENIQDLLTDIFPYFKLFEVIFQQPFHQCTYFV